MNASSEVKTLTFPVLVSARTRPYIGSEDAEDHEMHEERDVDKKVRRQMHARRKMK